MPEGPCCHSPRSSGTGAAEVIAHGQVTDDPRGADQWYAARSTWRGAEDAFTFYLAPAGLGDDQLKRFGAAAVIAPDGIVWATVVFAT